MVDRHADLEQDVGVVAVDDLRADDAGVRPVGLLDHQPDRVGIEHDVVVAEEQEDRTLDRGERLVRGRRERRRRARRAAADEGAGQGAGDRGRSGPAADPLSSTRTDRAG